MTLKTRFIALFIVLIVAFSSIALFTSISLSKINKFTEIDKKVYQLYNLSLELKKNEGDYFNWGLKIQPISKQARVNIPIKFIKTTRHLTRYALSCLVLVLLNGTSSLKILT